MTETEWAALADKQRDKLLERYRDINTRDDWWEPVYEDFIAKMDDIGIYVRPQGIYFSGFWSQGDGASFEGCVGNWPKFLKAWGEEALIPLAAVTRYAYGLPRFTWSSSGHYCHERSMRSDNSEFWVDNPYSEEGDPLRHAAWNNTQPEGGPFAEKEEEFMEFVREQACQLYDDLEKEYEYLTGDEEITRYILENVELDEVDEVEEVGAH